MKDMVWSVQQDAIFAHVLNSRKNLIARARAGTGKTTTIVEAVKRWAAANPGKTVLVCAFNKRIAEELVKKFGVLFNIQNLETLKTYDLERQVAAKGVTVKTLHAIGFAACRRFRDGLIIEKDADPTRAERLAREACGGDRAPDAIVRLVAKIHTLGRETVPHAIVAGDLTALMISHDLEPDDEWERMGWPTARIEAAALAAMREAATVKSGDVIDFSDMIFLPLVNGWTAPLADLIVVDEAQDMTTAQLELATGATREGGKVVIVGDDKQAIYGFRGADHGSLDRLKSELDADELGLTVTRRCGHAIVALAKVLVADFEAHESNNQGIVDEIGIETLVAEAGPGDFVLSRINAPLVSIAMGLLRAGKRARVAGRDIGKDLASVLRSLKARSVPELHAKIDGWEAKRVRRQEARLEGGAVNGKAKAARAKIDATRDQASMLHELADGARNVQEVVDRAESLFSDEPGAPGVVTCSSVHKAKGLEANRAFVLADTLRDGNDEERNIAYVAITRAKQRLTWVRGGGR